MPYCYRDPEVHEPPHIGAVRKIATLNPIAEIVQYFSDAAHADTTDANEMQRADRPRKRSHAAGT
jgi:hypothetical protein